MKRRILVLLLSGISLFAFSKIKKIKKEVPLDGTYIVLMSKGDNNIKNQHLRNSEIKFDLNTKKVSIYLGCNRISGSYEMNTNKLKTEILTSTRMACSGNSEDLFKNNFSKLTHYKTKGDLVNFYAGKELVITLVKKKTEVPLKESQNIEGQYKLESLREDEKMTMGDYSKTKMTIDKGRISCNVGCNSIGGEFSTEGNKISPLKLMMTEMFCEKVDALERAFVDNLNKIDSYSLKGDLLEFYQGSKLLLTFKKEDK